jgi:hypothetical protein
LRSDSGSDLPPDVQEWITATTAQLQDTLANPTVRARLLELLCGDDGIRSDDAHGETIEPSP